MALEIATISSGLSQFTFVAIGRSLIKKKKMEVHVAKMKPPVIEPTIKVIRVTAARAELLSHRGNESAD